MQEYFHLCSICFKNVIVMFSFEKNGNLIEKFKLAQGEKK